jgi:hypothetical protein
VLVDDVQLVVGVDVLFASRLQVIALGRGVALGVHEVGVPDRHQLAVLVPVDASPDRHRRATTEVRSLLGGDVDVEATHPDPVAFAHGVEVPGVVAGPEHVHAGERTSAPAAQVRRVGQVGGQARALEEPGRGEDAAPARPPCVLGIAPQRVVVAEAVGVVADPVAGRLLVPRRPPGIGPVDADLLPEALDPVVGEPAGRGFRRERHP